MDLRSITLVLIICSVVPVTTTQSSVAGTEELVQLTIQHKNQTFWLSNVTSNNADARTACLSTGGSLALFSTNNEYATVLNYLDSNASASGMQVNDVWIDIVYRETTNNILAKTEWKYESINTSLWRFGSPVSGCLNTSDTCCVHILHTLHASGSLEDTDCKMSSRFLCELPGACQSAKVPCEQLCTNNNQGGYDCQCQKGYTLGDDGVSCEDVNECLFSPCEQICNNTAGSYTCSCGSGFRLTQNGHSCTSTAKEYSVKKNLCEQTCVETNGSYSCGCLDGYTLASDKHSCTDVDECQELQLCKQICVNVEGSFWCECFSGYFLNDTDCLDVDECEIPNMCEQSCTNTLGSYQCGCYDGYTLAKENKSCNDVNECEINKTICSQTCSNTNGSYKCSCSSGFKLGADLRSCNQENVLCSALLPQCQQTCTFLTTETSCSCYAGYTLTADNTTCADVDECLTDAGGCHQICNNEPGSYKCGCANGFRLAADTRSCLPDDICSSTGLACHQKHLCWNGSSSCGCYGGYMLSDDRVSCSDQDECRTTNICQQTCTNTDGSYTCGCQDGYNLAQDGVSCQDIDECDSSNQLCDYQCINLLGSYTCGCPDGYTLAQNKTCLDVNECLNTPEVCQHTCINTDGSFTCSCHNRYILNENQSCVELIFSTGSIHQNPCSCSTHAFHVHGNPDNETTMTRTIPDDLLVNKMNTSMFKRTTISVPDYRLASETMGVSAILILSVLFALILVSDIHHLKCLLSRPPSLDVSSSSD